MTCNVFGGTLNLAQPQPQVTSVSNTHTHKETHKLHYIRINRQHLMLYTAMWPNDGTKVVEHCLNFYLYLLPVTQL